MSVRKSESPEGGLLFSSSDQRRSGLSLIEMATAVTFLAVALIGVSTLFISSIRSSEMARDQVIVTHYLRYMTEKIRATPFGDIAYTYNGYEFTIDELNAEGHVHVFVNEMDNSTHALELGLPRDLDGDGLATNNNVSGNYILLPIMISVYWEANSKPVHREHYFLLSQEE